MPVLKSIDFISLKNKGPVVRCNRSGVYYEIEEMVADLERPGFVHKNIGTLMTPEMDSGIKQGKGWIRP